nr:UDP-glycosyltransferase 83A1-like [Tanacetum cinerariifolium]
MTISPFGPPDKLLFYLNQFWGNSGNRDVKNTISDLRNEVKRFCTHCNKEGHNAYQCLENIGYPDWYKGKKAKKSNKLAAHVNSGFDEHFHGDMPFDMRSENKVGFGKNDRVDQKLVVVYQEMMKMFKGKNVMEDRNYASTSHAVSDKLEALKNLVPAQELDTSSATAADQLFKETADYILLLRTQLSPIGPLLASNRLAEQAGHFWQEDSTCLTWLDAQAPGSVIYIAFGSFTIFDQTQFEELALGLELTNRPFLWVVRPGITKETTATYPDGFMDRIQALGKIVDWAPQQKVLAHPSVACFLSHCGWNSTLEGVNNGVPFMCWPYFADQFHNESYICDIWKNGVPFNKNNEGIITRDEIENKVNVLLSNTMFKAKAVALKEKVTSSIKKGGSSKKNLTDFIEWVHEKESDSE